MRFYTFLCLFVSKTVNFEIFVWLTHKSKSQKSKKIDFPKIDSKDVLIVDMVSKHRVFPAINHDFVALEKIFQNFNFCCKHHFWWFLRFFDLWVKNRLFFQNCLKIRFDGLKTFSGSPGHLQIQWMTSYDDLKQI